MLGAWIFNFIFVLASAMHVFLFLVCAKRKEGRKMQKCANIFIHFRLYLVPYAVQCAPPQPPNLIYIWQRSGKYRATVRRNWPKEDIVAMGCSKINWRQTVHFIARMSPMCVYICMSATVQLRWSDIDTKPFAATLMFVQKPRMIFRLTML